MNSPQHLLQRADSALFFEAYRVAYPWLAPKSAVCWRAENLSVGRSEWSERLSLGVSRTERTMELLHRRSSERICGQI